MSWRNQETDEGQDIIYDGVEFGIAPSPTKGTANIQNANIATLSGEVLASYTRVAQQPLAITDGTLTPDGATNFTGPSNLQVGQWINVTASSVTSISTTTTPTTVSVDYLIVGGGGAGGTVSGTSAAGGGGGAGEVIESSTSIAVGTYAVTVGEGGDASSNTIVSSIDDGTSSSIAGIDTAVGGGGGGSSSGSYIDGRAGGSAGGGGGNSTTAGVGGTATAGNDGGDGSATTAGGGGGGGAGAAGANWTTGAGGDGGDGVQSSISGVAGTYYGGGGGGGYEGGIYPAGSAGLGGGGAGGEAAAGTAGTANTGGGGGGAGGDSGTYEGGDGGSGVVIVSYVTGTCIAIGGIITYTNTNTIHTFNESGAFRVLALPKTNQYYVSYKSGTTYKLSSKFDPTGANALTHGTTGSITFSTVAVPNSMIAKCVEKYTTATTTEYRYYILDVNGYVWLWDTAIYGTYGTQWMLPDPMSYSTFGITGISTLNGMLLHTGLLFIFAKPTVNLGTILSVLLGSGMNEVFPTSRKPAIQSNQGKVYYCDGNYIGEVFATTSLVTSIANIQSMCTYTASGTTGTISSIIAGSLPYSPDGTRIPVVFFTDVYGTQPTNVIIGTVYYLDYNVDAGTFIAYTTLTGFSPKTLDTGAIGTQYFTTFWPFGSISGAGGSEPLVQLSTQRVNLPANETAQCLAEVGNTVLIGGRTNLIYPWNQIDAIPSDFIALPENDIKVIVNVNNMGYVFAGNKGNVYITNNSVASLALKVPDYCAGVPGTPLTYIEPLFTWGDADYIRGRVYFSILDQTATKAGNCGGIWSFIPSQNIDPSQEVGMALRLENQQSYGDYDGYATIILPALEQDVTSPQYWAAWQDSYSTGTSSFGIDGTGTVPVTTYVIETDLIPTGTILSKDTYTQLEYKLSTALQSGDSVQLYYRLDSTSAWTSCGTANTETTFPISGYYEMAFQKTQWIQFRAVVTTSGTTASSFVRLAQIMLR